MSSKNLWSRNLHHKKAMGDIFYGNDDCEEMINGCIYKEDVIESMRRHYEVKALKRREKQSNFWKFFDCFGFLYFLLGGTKFYD